MDSCSNRPERAARALTWSSLSVLLLAATGWAQVNLPPGFELVEIGVNDKYTGIPAINECGQIVYTKDFHADSRLFLYDNGRITQLTDYDRGWLVHSPDINNAGTIVWHRKPEGYMGEVMMMKGGRISVLDAGTSPSINNHGHIAYEQFRGRACNASQHDIMLYDGRRSRQIYRSDWSDQNPEINDNGWVTWTHYDFCAEPYWLSLVLLYDGHSVSSVTAKLHQHQLQSINDIGMIAWKRPNENPLRSEIYIWGDGNLWRLPVETSVSGPRINNRGDILFKPWHVDNRWWDTAICRDIEGVPTFYRLTEDRNEDVTGDINDSGEAVWSAREYPPQGLWGGGVRFLRRIRTGDAEFDSDIDLTDLGALADCMTGPGRVSRGPEDCLCDCRILDIDHDDDVDLADFARFQNAFTGKK